MSTTIVRAENRRLIVHVRPNTGDATPAMAAAFYGPDRAVVTDGSDKGQSIEFVRDSGGRVQWIRVTGRIARREAP